MLSNEPKMSIVRCPEAPKGAEKHKTADFRQKYRTSLEESLLQSFFV